MARDEDFSTRRRREEKEELEREEEAARKKTSTTSSGFTKPGTGEQPELRLDQMLEQVEPLIQQLHQLYNRFFAGVEKRPPIERRKQLDQLMATLTGTPKPTAGQRFRFTAIQSSYHTHRDLWDRMLKQLEK